MQLKIPTDLPDELRERCEHVAARLESVAVELPAALVDSAAHILIGSDFVLGLLTRRPEAVLERIADTQKLSIAAIKRRADLTGLSEQEAMARLRRVRQLEMARIAWHDMAGWTDLHDTLTNLSQLADAMIELALGHAASLLQPRWGRPKDESGQDAEMLVLGMGKLGGHELNYSSDIDLVLLSPDGLSMDGPESIEVESYFQRLAQLFIRLLDQVTEDGFVFRVDTRLRPFGKSGPLVVSLPAFENYLLRHGRDWERYAYVKARLITGRAHRRELFDHLLTPFVYRRYLDYGVFDALRQMKRLISDEVARQEMHANIKLGAGGIREIEFITQVFQLIRGGQEHSLRASELQIVLPRLADLGVLSTDSVEHLTAAYRHLRIVENGLQAMEDRQTHELPSDDSQRTRLAYMLGFDSWSELDSLTARHRQVVAEEFARIAWDSGPQPQADTGSVLAAWETGHLEQLAGESSLAGTVGVVDQLQALRQSSLYNRMDEPSRQRLATTIARLLPALAARPEPEHVLGRVLPVIRAICRRSAYLALLNENPLALNRLLSLAGQSPMLARRMAEHPLLLDELLDARLFDKAPSRAELQHSLEEYLRNSDSDDVEQVLNALREFQRAAVFRIAVADRLGGLPLMQVSDRLTDTAELVLQSALDIARREMESKHGRPMRGEPGKLEEAGFAVIAYGKLGGLELGYGSDLDLVFIHDSAGSVQETTGPSVIDNQRYFARLVQRLIHFLSIQTSSGRLYEIDTRLRPSGASGLVVASLQSFCRYQREQAWTWEHQALLRSRSVAGSPPLCELFERDRREVLIDCVDRSDLRKAIGDMRQRMRQELARGTDEAFDVKQDTGGLADIEFLIDYWVLANAKKHPELVTYPDNVRQLEALERAELISPEAARTLKEAYLSLRGRIHELALNDGGRLVPAEEFAELRERIVVLWREVFDAQKGTESQ